MRPTKARRRSLSHTTPTHRLAPTLPLQEFEVAYGCGGWWRGVRGGAASAVTALLIGGLIWFNLGCTTVEGAGELMFRDAATSPGQLRKNVTSPGGTTAAGLTVLMGEGALEKLIAGTVHAARRRAAELSG